MKKCRTCSEIKPEEEFAWANKKRTRRITRCDSCRSAYHKEYYRTHKGQHLRSVKRNYDRYMLRNRQFVYDYLLEHPCVDCGETRPVVLEFDHVGEKDLSVSVLIPRSSLERLKSEIAKCEVRCRNCHMLKHAVEGNYWKVKVRP